MPESTGKDTAVRLDLVGLKCPLPVLCTRKALAAMAPKTLLEVVANDPMSLIDIPHLLTATGDTLLEQHGEAGVVRFLIRKGDGSRQ